MAYELALTVKCDGPHCTYTQTYDQGEVTVPSLPVYLGVSVIHRTKQRWFCRWSCLADFVAWEIIDGMPRWDERGKNRPLPPYPPPVEPSERLDFDQPFGSMAHARYRPHRTGEADVLPL